MNTETFYRRAKEFQSKRREVVDAYEKRIAGLQDARGSVLYDRETQRAEQDKNAALEALQREYSGYFKDVFDAMRAANGRRGTAAPSQDQLAILTALKMRDSVSEAELQSAAIACADNALCMSVLTEISRKNGYSSVYRSKREMSVNDAEEAVNALEEATKDFMQHDTTRAARIVSELYQTRYGNSDPPQKRRLFETKDECFHTLTPGLAGDTLKLFCDAVD